MSTFSLQNKSFDKLWLNFRMLKSKQILKRDVVTSDKERQTNTERYVWTAGTDG
jgi:hypothetical protein